MAAPEDQPGTSDWGTRVPEPPREPTVTDAPEPSPSVPLWGSPHPPVPSSEPAPGKAVGVPSTGRANAVGGIVVGVIVLGIVIAIAVAVVKAGPERGNRAKTVACVEDYLDAVAAGNSARVRAYAQVFPTGIDESEKALISDQVLAVSAEASPISDVSVEYAETLPLEMHKVHANFVMGDRLVEYDFMLSPLVDPPAAGPKCHIFDVLYEMGELSGAGGVVAVNGQPVLPDQSVILAVPGTYEVTSTSPYFAVENGTFRLAPSAKPSDRTKQPPTNLVLTDKGVDVFGTAVRDAVDTCLTSRTLDAGCGLDVAPVLADGTVVDEGSLVRTLTPEAATRLDTLTASLDDTDHTLAVATVSPGDVIITATGTRDGVKISGQISDGAITPGGTPTQLGIPGVQMADPDLQVVWR
ncbi:MAG: hypothetical protein FWD11_08745 [Micrococcales bacterium]|nr:hypothetical protein [Micrococcales bacterium]